MNNWTGHELSRRPLKVGAFAVECKRCAAKVGQWCIDLRFTRDAINMRTVHPERRALAERKGLL